MIFAQPEGTILEVDLPNESILSWPSWHERNFSLALSLKVKISMRKKFPRFFFLWVLQRTKTMPHMKTSLAFFNDLTPSNVRKAVKMTNFVSAKCNKKNSLMWCSWNWGIYIVVESQVWWFLMRKNV